VGEEPDRMMVEALWIDFKILAKTIHAVIKGAGAA
jgi:hypothetical protein